jgi:hypothetical protein
MHSSEATLLIQHCSGPMISQDSWLIGSACFSRSSKKRLGKSAYAGTSTEEDEDVEYESETNALSDSAAQKTYPLSHNADAEDVQTVRAQGVTSQNPWRRSCSFDFVPRLESIS